MKARAATRPHASFLADERGLSGMEFGLIAPVFALLMIGTVDIGGMLATKLDLNASISAATAYAQMNAANVNSTSGATLASNLSLIVAHARGPSWADSDVLVNNGPGSSVSNGARNGRGSGAGADMCYCPQRSGTSVNWGNSRSCKAACPSGGVAGKFVSLSASHQYTPIFFRSFSGLLTTSALIQTE